MEGGIEIVYPELVRLLGEAAEQGLRTVGLSGGEPLLYSHLGELGLWLLAHRIVFYVYTCGTITDRNGTATPVYADSLAALKGSSKVMVSLHGANALTHEVVTRIPGSFRAVLGTISGLAKAGIPFEIHFVPMKPNWRELHDIVHLASSMGTREVSILRLVTQGRARDSGLDLSRDEYLDLKRQIEDVQQTHPDMMVRTGAPWTCLLHGSSSPCTAGVNKLLLSAEGKVFPCEAFKFTARHRRTFYGRSLNDIWTDDPLLVKIRLARRHTPAACRSCAHALICNGGCLGQRQLAGSMQSRPDPLCVTHVAG
jgi:radical SAM protein with 4Fe4S-binding SPASM domain